jgi:hypothetical protein
MLSTDLDGPDSRILSESRIEDVHESPTNPTPTKVIVAPFVPLEVHTARVSVVNVTARPEDTVAVTVNGGRAIVLLLSAANVIVW